jgi:prepilin-type N-terminal cleavage/methylation domain-containing protein
MNVRRHSHSWAFTLVEILVAMAILSMVVMAIYSTWMVILRASKVGREAAAAVQRERITMRTLEDSLMSIRFFSANSRYYAFIADTTGDFAMLSFVARLPDSFPRAGRYGGLVVRRLTFTVEAGKDSVNQLVLRQEPLLMEPDVDEEEHPLVLARNVSLFKLDFFDANPRVNDWVEDWKQTNQLPKLVRISLGMGQAGRYSSKPQEEIIRTVALPAVPVQPAWQMAGPGAAAGQPGITNRLPGNPGNQPPGQPPGRSSGGRVPQ